MLKIKEVFRLKYEAKLSGRKIGRALNISHTVVNDYLRIFRKKKLSYDNFKGLNHQEITEVLFGKPEVNYKYPVPDWAYTDRELKRKGVTLELLHEEYTLANLDGHYGYTWFCNNYKKYSKKLAPSMRQNHKAGEKVFIDFSGMTFPVVNPKTGEIKHAEIFVAVLGASGYPFVKALPSQKKKDFIEAHVDMFDYFGGVPELLVPDNLKSAVVKADRYEPDVNPDYQAMANYYNTAVMPTRAAKPKDKAKVENAVRLVQRWMLARLRNRTFFSINELNRAIEELIPLYINKEIKHLGKSRAELYEELERPALGSLPVKPYEHREFKLLKVSIDYHIQLENGFYSVPYQLIHEKVEVWFSGKTVDIYHKGKHVATHPKAVRKGEYSTQKIHMPASHQKHLEWTPGRILNWGLSMGTHTSTLLKTIMERKPHPEMGFRACLGIMREYNREKEKGRSEEELERVSFYAVNHNRMKVKQIKFAIKHYESLVKKEDDEKHSLFALSNHTNIRGGSYYAD